MTYELQAAKQKHLQALIDLGKACGLAVRDSAGLEKNIDRLDYLINVMLCDNELAGFIEAQIIADEIHLYDVAVDPKFRRQGFAQALIEELTLQPCTAILLEVRESNQAALQLYRKCGFAVDGIRKNYYSAPVENAVLMSRKLS